MKIYCYLILCTLLHACVHRPLPTPKAPLDPRLIQAYSHFDKGHWEKLEKLIKRLPGSGPSYGMTLFYQAVLKGQKQPKKALGLLDQARKQRIQTIQRHENFDLLIDSYEAIFTALNGSCLIAEGPLRSMYLPQWKKKPNSTQDGIEKALNFCKKERENFSSFVSKSGDQKSQKANSKQPEEIASSQTSIVNSEQRPPKIFSLDQKQKQSVEVEIAVLLMLEHQKQRRHLQRLEEVIQWVSDQKQQEGLSIKLNMIEIRGVDEIDEQLTKISEHTQALLICSYSKKLQKAVLAKEKVQKLPILTISPYVVKKRKDIPLWKLFMSRSLIAKSLLAQAQQYHAKKLVLILPKGKMGKKILQTIKKLSTSYDMEIISSIQLKGNETSDDWEAISAQMIQKKPDTILFAVDHASINILVTYLANQEYWSASFPNYQTMVQSSEQKNQHKITKKYFKYLLWPNAYHPSLLKQAGRYLEGARLVTPVFKEGEAFTALNKTLQNKIARAADSLDPFIIDAINLLDQALRAHHILKISIKDLLTESELRGQYLPQLSFKNTNIMNTLHQVEVKNRSFQLLKP